MILLTPGFFPTCHYYYQSLLVSPSLSTFNTEVQELDSELFHLLYLCSTQVISSSQQT